jgi:hypothetical protein
MLAPPLELGAVKAMLALALPAVAVPMVGAPGTVGVVPVAAPNALAERPSNAEKLKAVMHCLKPMDRILIACSQISQHLTASGCLITILN